MIEIKIPKLGVSMRKATLVNWKASAGEEVKEEQIVLVIETDKVTFEVCSPSGGIIYPIYPEGKTCDVEEVVAYVAENRTEYEQIVKKLPFGEDLSASNNGLKEISEAKNTEKKSTKNRHIKSSPLARIFANEHNIDLRTVTGTGPGGRIIKTDILRSIEELSKISKQDDNFSNKTISEHSVAKEVSESVHIQGVRRNIFDNMFQSLSQSAQLTLHTEACAEPLVHLRERLQSNGRKVSYNAVLMKICAMCLRHHPRINSSVEGDNISVWRQINIGLAMENDDALIVPVVKNPDLKSIREIDKDILELVDRTRKKRLSPDDLLDGTFTISNLGSAEIDYFTPIIRPPESAILGVGRIVKKPIIRNDTVIAEKRITLSLTIDHRIIDGAPGARFLKRIKEMIEDPIMIIA
ncbi:dihydrolipoamide acetyltransferase family protein [Desulforhopalus singaporensis]|uniref:Dihydrolipoamide acetyltransferase component of pyruvate dehydrogenase complex n=1 Tax=Desulforhopalus singaporensis TaxID=91360 RepID=A0A1H0VKB5_9BACT|nr:dihydrolipoamide acetyltransferase family protein [Desulforhopalus singaporensis]SDP78870.1 pyruvate dehydrogenase E2 component (dihydrolipoamide acetyltransferase) [Desulforhopalus singaporensis]